MTEKKPAAVSSASAPASTEAHDRVAMLSVAKDGTPDQVNPELIGDKKFAVEATKRQFAEKAVSDADDAARVAEASAVADAEIVEQDPTIKARQEQHEKLAADAEKRAESVVEQLHQG